MSWPALEERGLRCRELQPDDHTQHDIQLTDRECRRIGHPGATLADRMLGSALTDREEAIEVMALSDDPWLRACAAYAMGEMRLTKFASRLDQWATDADPLLRATAVDAREKLRHAAAAAAGVDAL